MQIYHYHQVTGEFTQAGIADESPLEPGVFLIPACATLIAPPPFGSNEKAMFNGSAWELVSISPSAEVEEEENFIPTSNHVAIERSIRLSRGFDYDFGDARGVHRIGTTEADMAGWSEVTAMSSALIATGAGSTEITVCTDTGAAVLTAIEWQSILLAAGAFRQPIWQASFALQQTSPIPADYQDDTYWP